MRIGTMFALLTKALVATLVVASAACSPAPPLDKSASSSWAGSNLYFLHALPATEQAQYVETLAGWGVKVVRLWGKFTPFGPNEPSKTSLPNTHGNRIPIQELD